MGKTTRVHPVSLPILREGARVCGYRFGRIHQEAISEDHLTARYTAILLVFPMEFGGAATQQIQAALNTCFSSDVWIDRVWITKGGRLSAQIYTTTNELNINRPVKHWLEPLSNAELNTRLEAMALDIPEGEVDWLDDANGPVGGEI